MNLQKQIYYLHLQSKRQTKVFVTFRISQCQFHVQKIMKSSRYGNQILMVQTIFCSRQKYLKKLRSQHCKDYLSFKHDKDNHFYISSNFKPSITLQHFFKKMLINQQAPSSQFNFKAKINILFNLLTKCGGCDHLVPTFKNILITQNKQLHINYMSTVGWKLLLFNGQIQNQQFRQICLFIDPDIFSRSPLSRLNYIVKQRSLAIIILSIICPELLSIMYRLKIPHIVNERQATVILKEVERKIIKFMKIYKIQKRIKQISAELEINLEPFLTRILVDKEKMTWSTILLLLTSRSKKENKKEWLLLKKVAVEQWNLFSFSQKRNYIDAGLISQNSINQFCIQETQLFLIQLLKINVKGGSFIDQLFKNQFSLNGHELYFRWAKIMNQKSFSFNFSLKNLNKQRKNTEISAQYQHQKSVIQNATASKELLLLLASLKLLKTLKVLIKQLQKDQNKAFSFRKENSIQIVMVNDRLITFNRYTRLLE